MDADAIEVIASLAYQRLHASRAAPAWAADLWPSESSMFEALKAASPKFLDGLTELFIAPSTKGPPTLEFFQSTLPITKDTWGVYAITLKLKNKYHIYCGSGTNISGGIQARLGDYKNGEIKENTPCFVGEAIGQGARIVFKSVLLSIPKPTPGQAPKSRALIKLLESTMTYALGLMKHRASKNVLTHSNLWDINLFTYAGPCHHDCCCEIRELKELLKVPAHQLEADALVRKEQIREYQAGWYVEHREQRLQYIADRRNGEKREEILQAKKDYYQKNKEKIQTVEYKAKARAWRQDNKEKRNEQRRQRRKNDATREKENAQQRERRRKKKEARDKAGTQTSVFDAWRAKTQ